MLCRLNKKHIKAKRSTIAKNLFPQQNMPNFPISYFLLHANMSVPVALTKSSYLAPKNFRFCAKNQIWRASKLTSTNRGLLDLGAKLTRQFQKINKKKTIKKNY